METPLTSLKPQPIGAQVRRLVEACARRAEQELRAEQQRGYGGHLGTLLTAHATKGEQRHG